jgi:hypothetical protein
MIERSRDSAILEQHDPVGDADGHDLCERRAAEQRLPRARRAGQDAESAGAVAEVGQEATGLVAGVAGIPIIDEVAREVLSQSLRQGAVLRVVAGVEVRDPDLRGDIGPADCRYGAVELRVHGIAKPIRLAGDAREILALLLDLVARLRQGHAELVLIAGDPSLLEVRLGELWRRRASNAEALLHKRIAEVPRILCDEAGFGGEDLPADASGGAEPRLGPDALE